ncbi:MAG: guanitoxin biosynthesis MBL fold metallo-hydrolase GntH [Gammaproteobacteria bacterium]|nr:guanitoxin biosynthesis MBL fold metallo-hydrolase GntH [Gammaproteobacteria bacterium]
MNQIAISILMLFAVSAAWAAGGEVDDPAGIAPDRYVYYPGTEPLAEDEIRIIACGTGMPDARRLQASACFLVELGNGDKFIFDLGTGSMRNINSLMIPFEYLTKIFLTHLHTDHWADLISMWAGGWTAGRPGPLEVWGPSGTREDMGTKHAVEHMLQAFNWDKMTRSVQITPTAGEIIVHEFDYRGENLLVYEENGVTIRSIPAIHTGDGPVSFILEWAGLKIVIGGDTFPNTWFLKYATDADWVVHEAFMTPEQFVKYYGQPPQLAWRACCAFHTSPQGFGKVMSTIKPRHAVAYHFYTEEIIRYDVFQGIRETYDGPLSLATDMMVWNITRDGITERMSVSPDAAFATEGPTKQPGPDPSRKSEFTDWTLKARWDEGIQPAQKAMLDRHMEKYGLQDQDWRKELKKKE